MRVAKSSIAGRQAAESRAGDGRNLSAGAATSCGARAARNWSRGRTAFLLEPVPTVQGGGGGGGLTAAHCAPRRTLCEDHTSGYCCDVKSAAMRAFPTSDTRLEEISAVGSKQGKKLAEARGKNSLGSASDSPTMKKKLIWNPPKYGSLSALQRENYKYDKYDHIYS